MLQTRSLKVHVRISAAFSTSEQILLGSRDGGIKTSGTLESKIELHAGHPFVSKGFESAKSFTQDCRQILVIFAQTLY